MMTQTNSDQSDCIPSKDDVAAWKTLESDFEKNARLYDWLLDEVQRKCLYQALGDAATPFPSRVEVEQAPGVVNHPTSFLLTGQAALDALNEVPVRGDPPQPGGGTYSNAAYQALGGGRFMLAMDGDGHDLQKGLVEKVFSAALYSRTGTLEALAALAVETACVVPLKRSEFDLAAVAEQAAVRYVTLMYGIPPKAVATLTELFRGVYSALNFQIIGRHFEPGSESKSRELKEKLGDATSYISQCIDAYRRYLPHVDEPAANAPELAHDLREAVERVRLNHLSDRTGYEVLEHYVPLLAGVAMMAVEQPGVKKLASRDLAGLMMGLIAGTIGNIQNCVCHAVRTLRSDDPPSRVTKESLTAALQRDPPVSFLPRRASRAFDIGQEHIPIGSELVLAMGSLPKGAGGAAVWGTGAHACVGKSLGEPLILQLVSEIMGLRGLGDRYDPLTQQPLGIRPKKWGAVCESYPMLHDARKRIVQQPLNVVMKVKAPVQEHAEKLKQAIQYAAPRVEQIVRDSQHVHFAWFQMIENDTRLVLHTVYDGDFDPYLTHFAINIGPVFDLLFEHLEDAPPTPVKRFPLEFVQTIGRYNQAPVAGFFFSAYPDEDGTVSKLLRSKGAKP